MTYRRYSSSRVRSGWAERKTLPRNKEVLAIVPTPGHSFIVFDQGDQLSENLRNIHAINLIKQNGKRLLRDH